MGGEFLFQLKNLLFTEGRSVLTGLGCGGAGFHAYSSRRRLKRTDIWKIEIKIIIILMMPIIKLTATDVDLSKILGGQTQI